MRHITEAAIAYVKALVPSEDDAIHLSFDDSPILRDFCPGFVAAYIFDEGDSFQYIQGRHLIEASISEEELHQIGLENLANIAREKLRVEIHGNIFAVFLDGNFEASLLLLDFLWDEGLAHLVKGEFVAAFPARDILAFTDSESADGTHELNELVKRIFPGGDHLLSESLIRRVGGSWLLAN